MRIKPNRWYKIKDHGPEERGSFKQSPGYSPGTWVFANDVAKDELKFRIRGSSYIASEVRPEHVEPVPLEDLEASDFGWMIRYLDWSELPNKNKIIRKLYNVLVDWRDGQARTGLLVTHPKYKVFARVQTEYTGGLCDLEYTLDDKNTKKDFKVSGVGIPLRSEDVPEDKTYLLHSMFRHFQYNRLSDDQAFLVWHILNGDDSEKAPIIFIDRKGFTKSDYHVPAKNIMYVPESGPSLGVDSIPSAEAEFYFKKTSEISEDGEFVYNES